MADERFTCRFFTKKCLCLWGGGGAAKGLQETDFSQFSDDRFCQIESEWKGDHDEGILQVTQFRNH